MEQAQRQHERNNDDYWTVIYIFRGVSLDEPDEPSVDRIAQRVTKVGPELYALHTDEGVRLLHETQVRTSPTAALMMPER